MVKQGQEFCPPSVLHVLDEAKHGTRAELASKLQDMFTAGGMATDIATVASVVSECSYQRKLIDAAAKLTDAARENRVDDATKWQKTIGELSKGFSGVVTENTRNQIKRAIEAMHDERRMMKTGMAFWDRLFGGLFKEKLYVISGHGGAGKSALAVNMAWNMAKSGHVVRWVSWEEDSQALWSRIFARECGVDNTAMREARLTEAQTEKIVAKASVVGEHDFLAYYKLKDVGQIIDACGQCDLIVIDGLSRAPAPAGMGLVERVGYIMQYLGELSHKTGATVIVLAHVNSDGAKNGASMSGLYGGQAVSFDPEGVVDIRRADDADAGQEWRKVAVKVLKNRYGPEGVTEYLAFNGSWMTFQDGVYHGR
jgi:replicative DNA helicase